MRIITFNVVDWFQILQHNTDNFLDRWRNYEVRIHSGIDRIFKILEDNNIKATFFISGYIAQKHPEIVRNIHNLGYEVAVYSDMYNVDDYQSRNDYKKDLSESINSLESITGEKVLSYRDPGFVIKNKDSWFFETLNELGIKYDSSISLHRMKRVSCVDSPQSIPSIIEYNGLRIKEFPVSINTFFGNKFTTTTTNEYFRFLPYRLFRKMIKDSDYTMSYFRPRDFDVRQPILDGLSLIRKFKLYYNLSKSSIKLNQMAYDFDFIDMKEAGRLVDWDNVPIIDLNCYSDNK